MAVRQEKRHSGDRGAYKQWIADFWYTSPDGKERFRVREDVKATTKAQAQEAERDIIAAIQSGTYVKPRNRKRKAEQDKQAERARSLTFKQFAEEFMRNHSRINNKPSAIEAKDQILKDHLVPAFGELRLFEITARAQDAFKADRLAAGLSKKTINNLLTVLSTALSKGFEWGYLDKPAKVTKIKQRQAEADRVEFLSELEVAALLATADAAIAKAKESARPRLQRVRASMVLMLYTGLRIGEVRALRWGDIDLGKRALTVSRTLWEDIEGTPKGGRTRELPLNKECLAELLAHRERVLDASEGAYVFGHEDGSPLTRQEASKPIFALGKLASIGKAVRPHLLRHTFASHLVMRGVALKAVQELLGHTDIKMTLKYAHLDPSVKRSAVDCLGSAFGAGVPVCVPVTAGAKVSAHRGKSLGNQPASSDVVSVSVADSMH